MWKFPNDGGVWSTEHVFGNPQWFGIDLSTKLSVSTGIPENSSLGLIFSSEIIISEELSITLYASIPCPSHHYFPTLSHNSS